MPYEPPGKYKSGYKQIAETSDDTAKALALQEKKSDEKKSIFDIRKHKPKKKKIENYVELEGYSECQLCGAVISDKNLHLDYHNGEM